MKGPITLEDGTDRCTEVIDVKGFIVGKQNAADAPNRRVAVQWSVHFPINDGLLLPDPPSPGKTHGLLSSFSDLSRLDYKTSSLF